MVAPFIAIYVLNWIVFIIIITTLAKKNWRSIIRKTDSAHQGISFHQQFVIAVALSILFGLGWGIGLFVSGDVHENHVTKSILSALFVVITSFHGLFVFIMHSVRSKDIRKKWKAVFNIMSKKQATFSSTATKFDRMKKSFGMSISTRASYASSTLTHSVGKTALSLEMESIQTSTLKSEEEGEEKVELQVNIQALNPILENQEPDSWKEKDISPVCSLAGIPTEMDDNKPDEVEVSEKESLSMTAATKDASVPSQDEVCACEKMQATSHW